MEEKQQNRLLTCVLFAFFVSGAASQPLGSFIPFLRSAYGFSYDLSGILLSCQSVGNLVAVLIAGLLPSLLGRRRSILVLAVWMAAAYLIFVSGPGNDLVSATALTAVGAHLILFTTGRGTPFGAPAPTVKISTNTALYDKKRDWIDFNAGTAAQGESLDSVGERLLAYVLAVAGGEKTKAEQHGAREISIFKDGVVL